MPTPATHPSSAEAEASLYATMRVVTLLIGGAAALITPYLLLYSGNPLNAVAPLWIALLSFGCYGLVRLQQHKLVPYLMVFGVLIGGALAVIMHGSLRSAGVVLFPATVAGAGIFLGRTALFVTVGLASAIMTSLLYAERAGWIDGRNQTPGLAVLLTHLGTLCVVGIMVYYSRRRAQITQRELEASLAAHQRTEAERDRLLKRFERIFQSSPTPMVAQSAKTAVIVDVNPAFERGYGYTRAQVLGRSDHFLWADPSQRDAHRKRLLEQHRVTDQPALALRSDGSVFEALLSSEISPDRDDQLVISNVIDMSDQIRQETLLMEMAQGMTTETGEAFFHALARHMGPALNADAVMVSEKVSDTLLRTQAIWQHGERLDNFFYPVDATPSQQALRQKGLYTIDHDLIARFEHLPAALSRELQAYAGQSLRDQDGSPIGVLAAFWRQPTDINTERQALMAIFSSRATAELIRMRREREIRRLNHTLEQRVRARTAELQKLNAELDSFSYSVSHDLKSPLRAIDGFTQLLADALRDRLQPHESQWLERVLSATQRMGVLIADLLALARVSQGDLAPGLTNISRMAEDILRSEQEKHPGRSLQWEIEPDLKAWCDPRLTRIALENLLGNAVKYTRNTDVARITLQSEPRSETAVLWIRLQDNGVGFDMAYADKLFKPFQRLHQADDFDGTGIGLATVRRIVERHGGSIEGFSEPGRGATFRFHFGRFATQPAPALDSHPTPQA